MAETFRDREVARIKESGWLANLRLREVLEGAGLPSPLDFLVETFSKERWRYAERTTSRLRDRFRRNRFADSVDYGLLLVPRLSSLDTRTVIPARVRAGQHPDLGEDFLDAALPAGVDLASPEPWTPFLTVVGSAGIAAGSHNDIVAAPREDWVVDGFDTRTAMTRQLWGARLLQSPPGVVPDSDLGETWTFTLFPGEPLVAGKAVSGTVLKGRVRFRLGKTTRGIGSVRVAPAVPCRQSGD